MTITLTGSMNGSVCMSINCPYIARFVYIFALESSSFYITHDTTVLLITVCILFIEIVPSGCDDSMQHMLYMYIQSWNRHVTMFMLPLGYNKPSKISPTFVETVDFYILLRHGQFIIDFIKEVR